MKRIATISAVLLTVICIIAANGDVARPRILSKSFVETVRLSGQPGLTASPQVEEAPVVKTVKISGDKPGNSRYPGVAENVKGDRLVIFRGPNSLYWYSFYRKDGSWTTAAAIPNQPALEDHTCVDVDADSTGRFHCVWEEPDVCFIYASFLDGVWTTPVKLPSPGKHDMGVSIAVRSNDEVIIANSEVIREPYLTKDIFFFFKGKDESAFRIKNMTEDPPSSTQPSIAVDANDHIWLGFKAEPKLGSEELVIIYIEFGKNDEEIAFKTVTDPIGWNFWPQAAVNTDGKLMLGWTHTQDSQYECRLYDPATKKWTEVIETGVTIPRKPWAAFWSKMVSHGNEFYWAVMDTLRVIQLLKFNEKRLEWENVAEVSNAPVEYFDLYSGYDKMLIAWGESREPTSVYLTTVAVTPAGPQLSEISGKVQQDSKGVGGVTLTGLPENPTTDSSGNYSQDVDYGWAGTVIPNKSGYRFEPPSRDYPDVTSDQTGQDYEAIKQFNLTITATSGGTTTPPPATYPKDLNSSVTVKANPNSNYRFDKWEVDGVASGSVNPITLKIDKDIKITANFIKQFNLTITATSGGTTTPPPATYPYDLNSSVTVTAIPDLNYRFDKWEVDEVASGSVNPMTLPIDKSKTIRANFIRIKSAANLKVEKRVERGFFNGYTLNALTWEANPENAEMGLTVSAQRVYRKARAEDNTKWARIVELSGAALKYDDRNVPSDSDYVYAVTCVDNKGNESAIY